jgi:hypothetical protein
MVQKREQSGHVSHLHALWYALVRSTSAGAYGRLVAAPEAACAGAKWMAYRSLLQAPELLGMGAAASAAQALAQQHCAQSRPACSNAATSRMDFDAVRRELFTPGNGSSAPVWPFQAWPKFGCRPSWHIPSAVQPYSVRGVMKEQRAADVIEGLHALAQLDLLAVAILPRTLHLSCRLGWAEGVTCMLAAGPLRQPRHLQRKEVRRREVRKQQQDSAGTDQPHPLQLCTAKRFTCARSWPCAWLAVLAGWDPRRQ